MFILRPILRLIDHREERIEQNRANAEADDETTAELGAHYAHEMATIRRAADDEFRDKRRAALDAHGATLGEKRHQADQAVAQVREEAMKQIEGERGAYESLAPGLADLIAERLGIGGKST